MVKEEPGVEELGELKSVRLVDKWASLNAPNNGTNCFLLTMVKIEYIGDRNSPPLRVPLRGKG